MNTQPSQYLVRAADRLGISLSDMLELCQNAHLSKRRKFEATADRLGFSVAWPGIYPILAKNDGLHVVDWE